MNKLESAQIVIDNIKSKTDEVMLFCSLGKDSLVVLDLIAQHFKRIVCVFMYFVKDLEHINRFANQICKRYTNVEFVQVPHWTLSYVLRGGMYSVPNPKIKKLLKLADVVKATRLKYGIEYCFLGMKKADGMNRNLMLKGYEQNKYENAGMVYPLADWTQKEVLAYMRMHRLPEPVRYGTKTASNGVGFNLDCHLWMREHFPQDLEKFYQAFPLSRRILFEYDEQQKKLTINN